MLQINSTDILRISSKRIAEKTGKIHSNVLRDIRSMMDELEIVNSNLNPAEYEIVKRGNGQIEEIKLNERLSLCLGSGYSIKLRMAIIDDWAELKSNKNTTGYDLPKTFSEALRQLAESIEAKEAMEKQLEAAKPAVDFYNAVTDSMDAQPMGEVAKVLNMGVGRNELFKFLREKKVLMVNNVPYQEFIDRGYFRIIEQKFTKPDGSTSINIKTLVFQKGMDHIFKLYTGKKI